MKNWTPDFDPTQDVSSTIPVWVRLPHLPLHCWNSDSLEAIRNKLGKYIDKAERKDQFSCARICVEVDLETGLSEEINLIVVEWSHIQELDYEQIPFKCRFCHGYGHFSRNCKKKSEEELEKENDKQWTQVQKSGTSNQGPRNKGKEGNIVKGEFFFGKNLLKPQAIENPNASSNHFVVLSYLEAPILEEGELQQFEG